MPRRTKPPLVDCPVPCVTCREIKHPDQFGRTTGGHPRGTCRACASRRARERYRTDAAHRERVRDRNRRAYAESAAYYRAEAKRYYAAHREAKIAQACAYQRAHRDEINARRRERRAEARAASA